MDLSFAEATSVAEVAGKVRFTANGLVRYGQARGLPDRARPLCVVPDGTGYTVYLMRSGSGPCWSLLRGRTADGLQYEGIEVVFASPPESPAGKEWLGHAAMAWAARDGKLLCMKWSRGEGCHAAWCLVSSDGQDWRFALDRPAFEDHDSNGLMWDPRSSVFVDYQATYQAWPKPFVDNIGDARRRVMHTRTSTDGVVWNPPESISWGDSFIPEDRLITPDDDDPAELEFYRFHAFPYAGRYVGMVLNYAPSPGRANTRWRTTKHGPHLSGEWWLSDDGHAWRRPFRDVFAPGEAPGIIQHAPMTLGGRHLWLFNDGSVFGLPEGCLFGVSSLASASLTTHPFPMPDRPLTVRAQFGHDGSPARGMRGQGYVMAELLDERGAVVEGCDRERCAYHDSGRPAPSAGVRDLSGPPLAWEGNRGTELAGRTVSVRLFFRDARVYGLSTA